jgi:hypothetical protein
MKAVADSCAHAPAERRDALLRELREHIHEAMYARTSGRPPTLQDVYATLSEMDLPETYAETPPPGHEIPKPSSKLVALGLICSGFQIVGLAAVVAGIPVVGAIAGMAAIVSSFLSGQTADHLSGSFSSQEWPPFADWA